MGALYSCDIRSGAGALHFAGFRPVRGLSGRRLFKRSDCSGTLWFLWLSAPVICQQAIPDRVRRERYPGSCCLRWKLLLNGITGRGW
jgi:hypothetical protein